MSIVLKNNAHSFLSDSISSTDTTIPVLDTSSFPAPGVGEYFYCTIESTSGTYEIVKVTQVNPASFIVERGQEDTIPVPFMVGSSVEQRITVQTMTDFLQLHIDDSAFGSAWNGDTTTTPSRNAVYDKFIAIESLIDTLPLDGDKGDITVSSSGDTWVIDNGAVTYAKMQDVSAQYKLLGRASSGAGDVEEITSSADVFTALGSANNAAIRTNIGLGTIATQNSNNVTITGGTIAANVSGSTVTNDDTATVAVSQILEDWLAFNDTTSTIGDEFKFWHGNVFGNPTPGSARVYRMNRILAGAAALSSSDAPQTVKDYLFASIGTSPAQLATIAGYSPIGLHGGFFATRTADYYTAFGSTNAGGAQAVSGIALNDDTNGDPIACAVFGLSLRNSGVGGTTESEITVANAGSVVDITPNTGAGGGGKSIGINVTSGWPGYTNYVSSLIHLGSSTSPSRSRKGIVVEYNALDTSVGSGGNGLFAEFYTGQSQRWVDNTEAVLGELWADSNGLILAGSSGLKVATFRSVPSGVNAIRILNAATGSFPIIEAFGSDTNSSLYLRGQAAAPVVVERIDTATNSVVDGLIVRHTVTGTPQAGTGVAIHFVQETADNNYEVGAHIEAVATNVGSGTEEFNFVFELMTGGVGGNEVLRLAPTSIRPGANDGQSLGIAGTAFSDLFLASGGVINWNSGDVTVTHSANTLAFAGASSGYTFDAAVLPSANDVGALGASGQAFSDLFLAAGGVINFNAGDVTITAAANQLTFAGASNGIVFNNPITGLDVVRAHNSTAIPAGGTAGAGFTFSSTTNFGIFFGSGAPTLSAAKGSLYLRSDGSTTNDRAYINTNGGTTWTALTTVA